MKTITRYFDNSSVSKINLNFHEIYSHIGELMPLGEQWVVDTGKRKRLYFWFYGNKYQGNQLCWSQIPN